MTKRFTRSNASLPEFIALIALITSLVAMSIDAMLPALPNIAADLMVSDVRQTQWVITSLIFGMSFGQLIFGPLSDAYGRRFGIFSGIALFCVGALISMMATSLTMLIAGRVIQGIGVSGPRIASMALVRDKYVGDAMARVMSFVMMVFILVPMFAPVVGQVILWFANWQAIFAFFIVMSAVAALWLALRQPETLSAVDRRPFRFGLILNSILLILKQTRVTAFGVTSGLIFGGLLAYVASAQLIFQSIYQLGDSFPIYFATLAFGVGVASLVNSQLVMRLGSYRLSLSALIGLIVFSSLLVIIGHFSGGVPALWVFMTLGFMSFFFVGILFGNLNALAMVPLGKMAGIGAAVIGSISNIVAVVVAGVVGWFFTDSLMPILIGLLITGLLSLVLVLWAGTQSDNAIDGGQ